MSVGRYWCSSVLLTAVLAAGCAREPETAVAAGSGSSDPGSIAGYRVDPFWPRELPEGWMFGNVVGIAVDSQDNIWITHRPNSQRGAEKTPPVIAFDPAGNVIRTLGGPGAGYEWGTQVHGLYIDHRDNVWVGFGGGLPYDVTARTTTDNALFLKFAPSGEFLLQIGKWGMGTEGSSSTKYLGNPTDVYVAPETNEAFIADGYLNRRIIVVDGDTGEFKRLWGAFGKEPDDAPMPPFSPNGPPRPHFDTPHCVAGTNDGLIYVCDRGNQRIQVFRQDGTFVREAPIPPSDIAFSYDPAQSRMFVVGGGGVQIVRRDSLEIDQQFGRRGRQPGQFLSAHSVAYDRKGNLYVTETLDGSRVQKFVPTSTSTSN